MPCCITWHLFSSKQIIRSDPSSRFIFFLRRFSTDLIIYDAFRNTPIACHRFDGVIFSHIRVLFQIILHMFLHGHLAAIPRFVSRCLCLRPTPPEHIRHAAHDLHNKKQPGTMGHVELTHTVLSVLGTAKLAVLPKLPASKTTCVAGDAVLHKRLTCALVFYFFQLLFTCTLGRGQKTLKHKTGRIQSGKRQRINRCAATRVWQ